MFRTQGRCPPFSPTGEAADHFPDQRHRLVHAADRLDTAVVYVRFRHKVQMIHILDDSTKFRLINILQLQGHISDCYEGNSFK